MAKNTYIGIGNVARKVKKMYVGINGVARKVKKAYIGIGNVARLFFSGGEIEYVGAVTSLSVAREPSSTGIGEYALFGGGGSGSDQYTNRVDAYNGTLTRSIPTGLSKSCTYTITAANSNYAIFAGGWVSKSFDTVDAYNSSLTRTTAPTLTKANNSSYDLFSKHTDSTYVGNYALLFTKDVYNTSLTKSMLTANYTFRYLAHVGNYALAFGTIATSAHGITDFTYYASSYNSSLTRSDIAVPNAKYYNNTYSYILGRAESSSHVLLPYGASYSNSKVDVYNTALTLSSLSSDLPGAARACDGTSDYAVIICGALNINTKESNVITYDNSLTRENKFTWNYNGNFMMPQKVSDKYLLILGAESANIYASDMKAFSI